MINRKGKIVGLIALLVLAQSVPSASVASSSEHSSWQKGLELLYDAPTLASNPIVQNAIKAKSVNSMAAAKTIFDAAEFLKKSEQLYIAWPFYRAAWTKALAASNCANPTVQKYAHAYANFALNEIAAADSLSEAHSTEDSRMSLLEQARSMDESARSWEASAGGDQDRLREAQERHQAASRARVEAASLIKEAQKQRADARKAVTEAARHELWYHTFTEGRNAHSYSKDYQFSEDMLFLYLGHLIAVQGPEMDKAAGYRELARLKLKANNRSQATEYYRKAVFSGARAWTKDSGELIALVAEFQAALPESAGSIPQLLQSAKKVEDDLGQAKGTEIYKIRPGETKNVSPHIAISLDVRGTVSCIASLNGGSVVGFPLKKNATLYDEGKTIKISFKGVRTMTVFTCYREEHPVDADIAVERTASAAPKIQPRSFSKVFKDFVPDFFIGGVTPAYSFSADPLLLAYVDTANSPNRHINLITNYGVIELKLPYNVGERAQGTCGPLYVSVERIPNASKHEADPLYKVSCKPVGNQSEPKILSIAY